MKKLIIHEGKKITVIHYQPFDSVNGIAKTEEEALKIGELVEEIPEPEKREGYYAKPLWDETKKEVYYEYIEMLDDDLV